MERIRESKWIFVLLSVLLASLFWLYVRAEVDPELPRDIRDVAVTLTGESILESQGLTITAISHETVDLNIKAAASVNDKLSRDNISVVLDVSRCSEGEQSLSYNVVLPNNINAEGVVVQDRTPQKITVTVEKLYSESFEIECILRGSIAQGYQAGEFIVSPETIVVSGSVEQVSQVAKVTAVLEGQDLNKRFTGELPLTLLDAQGNVLEDLDVKLSAETAYVSLPVLVVKEIPLTVKYLPGAGATEEHITSLIFPSSITVSGAEEDMAGLEEISLGSVDLAKVVGTNAFTYPINLDPSLQNVSGISEATVTVTVTGLATKAFDVSNIELINTPEGYTATATTQVRTVVVRGDEAALEQLDASQIRVVADLSNVTAVGSTSVPVKVYLDANSEVGVIGDYTIVVNVSR